MRHRRRAVRQFSISGACVLALCAATVTTLRAQEPESGARKTTPPFDDAWTLHLKLEENERIAFRVKQSPSKRDTPSEPTKDADAGDEPEAKTTDTSRPSLASTDSAELIYDLHVANVEPRAFAIRLACSGVAAPPNPPPTLGSPDSRNAASSTRDDEGRDDERRSKPADSRVHRLLVNADGQIESSAVPVRETPEIPAEICEHLRLLFGSGLHTRSLEVGKEYTLASLFAAERSRRARTGEKDMGDVLTLRFEGRAGEDAVFSLFLPEPVAPAIHEKRDEPQDPTDEVAPPVTKEPPVNRRVVGTARFSFDDGLLFDLDLSIPGAPRSAKQSATPARSLSIRRLTS